MSEVREIPTKNAVRIRIYREHSKIRKQAPMDRYQYIIDVPHPEPTSVFGSLSRNNYVRHANRMIYHDGQYKLLTTLTLNFEIENEFLRAEVKFKARPKPPEELSYSLNISTMHYNQDKLDPKDWKNNEVTSKCSTTHFYRSKGVVQFDIRFSFIKPKELHIEGPSFSQSMSSLFLDQASSDVKIICGEEEFPCHKFVLCSRSDVFKAMLEGENYKEGQDGILEIKDTNT